MEELYEKILWDGYGLQFRGGTRTRTGLVCRTDRGLRELKKPRGTAGALRLAYAVKAQLCENGFPYVSRMYETVEGDPFYRWDGVLYLLEDPMPAETLEEDGTAAFVRGAAVLGRMHRAARGFSCPAVHWDAARLPQLYGRRRGELAKLRRRGDKRGRYDAIDLLLLQYYDRFMERAAEAEELLRRGGYAAAVERAAREGAFCHNAFKGEALRLAPTGEIWVGNFDRCSAELPLADLAAYLRRFWRKTGDRDGVQAVLAAYGTSLSAGDLVLLEGMLLYPEKFLRLVHEYYNRRRTCVSPAMRERLAAAAAEEEAGAALRDILGGA